MRLALLGVLSVLLLVSLPSPAAAEEHVVTVTDFEFSPAELRINKDDMVRWVWESGAHTVIDGDPQDLDEAGAIFEFAVNAQNRTFEFTFTEAGTVEYFSQANPDVRGTITILEGTPVTTKTWGWLKQVFENPAASRRR